jgi:hypothetical protein
MGSDGADLLSSPVAVKAKKEIIYPGIPPKALKRGLLGQARGPCGQPDTIWAAFLLGLL